MKALSEEELLINQQATSVAASVVPEAVVAATRCEQVTDAMTAEAVGVGAVTRWGMRVSRKVNRAMPAVTNVGGMAKYMEMAGLPTASFSQSRRATCTRSRTSATEDSSSPATSSKPGTAAFAPASVVRRCNAAWGCPTIANS